MDSLFPVLSLKFRVFASSFPPNSCFFSSSHPAYFVIYKETLKFSHIQSVSQFCMCITYFLKYLSQYQLAPLAAHISISNSDAGLLFQTKSQNIIYPALSIIILGLTSLCQASSKVFILHINLFFVLTARLISSK